MKMKIAAILIGALFIGLASSPIIGAEEQVLEADITVTVNSFIGLVSPVINVETDAQKNDTVEFKVDINETDANPDNHTYYVNDTLIINLDIVDNSGREAFLLPRLMFYRVVALRDFDTRTNGVGGFLAQLMPFKAPFGQATVVNTVGGSTAANNITIDVNYEITKETYNESEGYESMELRVFVMGFLPGNVNGLGFLDGQIPIVDFKTINLEVQYNEGEVAV